MHHIAARAALIAGFIWGMRWPLLVIYVAGVVAGLVLGASPVPA